MEDVSVLDGMKRAELQRLAKQAGIKANMKVRNEWFIDCHWNLNDWMTEAWEWDPIRIWCRCYVAQYKPSLSITVTCKLFLERM